MQLTAGEDLQYTVLHAPIGICILDANTLVAEIVNDKFLEVAGKPYEAIFGKHYWDAFAEARVYYEVALAGAVQTGEPYYADEVELMLIRHGREEMIFVTFVYAPVKDKKGKVTKVAVWVLENTKQVNARQQVEAARAAFQLERDRLKNFFMQAPAGICILSGPELVYELVNPAYQQILHGRKLQGRPIFEALPELVGTPLQQVLLDVYHTGQPYVINELLIPIAEYEGGPTRDRYFSFNYEARRDENGKVDGILVFVFEVTGMIEVQHELRKAREQSDQQKRIYETITSNTPDLMYVFGLDYRFTYANSALLTMWGKTWDTAVGKSLLENGYEPWHAEMHEREIDQIKATKQSVRGEVSFPHATLGRRVYDYILIPVLDENGEVEAVAGTTRDVTERKQSEELLARSAEELKAINEEMAIVNEEQAASNEELAATNEELAAVNEKLLEAQHKIEQSEISLRMAIEAADSGTFSINASTLEFFASPRLKELFGFGRDEEVPYGAWEQQIREDYRLTVSTLTEAALTKGERFELEYPVIRFNDGKQRWLRGLGTLQHDSNGVDSFFTGIIIDITEQKEDEQRKNDFIGMVSHELKTPLTSLTAIVQVLHAKLKKTEDPFVPGALEKAVVQVRKMSSMINGFLNISRLESGKIQIDKQPFIIGDLVKEIIQETNLTGPTHIIELQDCDKAAVKADRDKIGSVLSNLLSNAIKYSPKGSNIKVNCRKLNGAIEISVTDEGLGIRPEDREHIFDRYYRVENKYNEHVSGFGIGLYLSAEIIGRHNGKIWVESESGKGSTFYFTVPL